MGAVIRNLSSWKERRRIIMKIFLVVTLFAAVLGHQGKEDFHKWAKNKAMESCFGEDNHKIWTVQMKKAVAKCSQQDAPELQLLQFRAPYKTVNALLEASEDMENNDMQMMFNMFRFMHKMHQSQNQQRNDYNQFRPYSQEHDMSDNIPMPMKWMMKMMTMKNVNQEYDGAMKMRHMDPMESRMDKIEAMLKSSFYNQKNAEHNNFKIQGLFGKLFDLSETDMDYGNMFHKRHARAAEVSKLDLGDRLVEKLKGQKQEMEEKVGNLTCILQEVNFLDAKNEISISAMKKDLEQYNLPSVWFKEKHEALLDTCYEMATTLPAELEDGYIVEGEFGTVNMAQLKTFMSCCTKGKAKLCMNQDIKQKIEENFGPVAEILTQSGLTENQLFPLVQDLLHGQESYLDDLF